MRTIYMIGIVFYIHLSHNGKNNPGVENIFDIGYLLKLVIHILVQIWFRLFMISSAFSYKFIKIALGKSIFIFEIDLIMS